MRLLHARIVLVALAVLGIEGAALAEPTSDERALALTLFKRGRDAMAAGDVDVACRSFEESQRLDPGGGTLLNLAVCHEKQGRTATAWTEYAEALAVARRDGRSDRIELAQKNRAALEARLVHITIVVSAADLGEPNLRIVRDGVDIPREAWGVAVPVDPGQHVVEAWIGETRAFEERVTVEKANATSVVTLAPVTTAPTPVTPVEPEPAPAPKATSTEAGAREPDGSRRAVLGWALVGTGIVAAGVGTIFGVSALSDKAESDRGCPNDRCTVAGVGANDRAKTEADVSTVSIAVAVVAAGVGIYLLATRSPTLHNGRARWLTAF